MHYNVQRLETVTPVPAITVAEFKEYQLIGHDLDDDLVTRLLLASTRFVENHTEHALLLTRYRMMTDQWCHTPGFDWLNLPWAPIRAIEKVEYTDVDGASQFLDTDLFRSTANDTNGRIRFTGSLPTLQHIDGLDQVVIQFIVGYGAYAAVTGYPYDYPVLYRDPNAGLGTIPETIRQAVALLAGHWYENREAVVTGSITKEIEFSLDALMHQSRVLGV